MPHSPEHGPQSPEIPKPKEWREITRAHEVVAIGDLHGRREALLENGTFGHILAEQSDGTLSWEGGDRRVVFLGDILADRFLDGPRILQDIHHLSTEAQKAGGEVTLLAGNHDIWGFSYLFHEDADGKAPREQAYRAAMNRGQGNGLFALLPLAGIDIPPNIATANEENRRKRVEETLARDEVRNAIRHRIAGSPELQSHYTQYHIAHVIDDTLFLHCDPDQAMMDDLLARSARTGSLLKAVQEINTIFRENVRVCLQKPDRHPDAAYREVIKTYTLSYERKAFSSIETLRALRANGINAIIHGHTAPQLTHKNQPAEESYQKFLMLSADNHALIDDNFMHRRSIARINKNGEVFYGENEKKNRTR